MRIDVRADISQLQKRFAYLKGAIPAAAVRAMNKTADRVKTEARRKIQEKRHLPLRVINKELRIERASRANMTATVVVSGKPIALKHYSPAGPRGRPKAQHITRDAHGRFVSGTGSPPISVNVTGTRKIVKGAFFGPNDHLFKRVGKARLPIEVLIGPSIPTAISNTAVEESLQFFGQTKFKELFAHEVERELNRGR
jgi:hypothetical protein